LKRRLARACALIAVFLIALPGSAMAGDVETKIVGGGQVAIEDHPWQVAVFLSDGGLCGGSIRDASHVVTAAHCVVDTGGDYPVILQPGDITVGYGSANLDSLSLAGISAVTVDPPYLRRGVDKSDNDDAVLTLSAPLTFGSPGTAPQPIAFATDQELNDQFDAGGFITGWGTTSENGDIPADGNLRGAPIPLQNDQACIDEYGAEYVPALMICAGGSGTDTCQGDSGGPLTIDTNPGGPPVRKLVGITSFGHGCGRAFVPGVYTWVQSPHVLSVIGNPNPTPAPQLPASNPTVSGVLRVGRQVTCNPPVLAGATPVTYIWWLFSSGGGYTELAPTTRTMTIPGAGYGLRILCDARYESAGGFVYTETPGSASAGPIGRAAFLANTLVSLSLGQARIPASGPLRVVVANGNNFTVTGSVSAITVRALPASPKPRRVALGAKAFSIGPKGRVTVTLDLPKKVRDALRSRGQLAFDVTAHVRDPAGHTRRVTARLVPKLKQ
jgi:hypothetical protein